MGQLSVVVYLFVWLVFCRRRVISMFHLSVRALQSLLCCVLIPFPSGLCCLLFTWGSEFFGLYLCLIWEIIRFFSLLSRIRFSSLPSFFFLFFWNDHHRNPGSFVGILAIPQIPKALLLDFQNKSVLSVARLGRL